MEHINFGDYRIVKCDVYVGKRLDRTYYSVEKYHKPSFWFWLFLGEGSRLKPFWEQIGDSKDSLEEAKQWIEYLKYGKIYNEKVVENVVG